MFDDLMRNMGLNERFAKAQNNHDEVDPREAAEYVGQFMRQAPPELQHQVLQQYISQLDPRQRQALARAMVQHQGTPVQDVRHDDDDDLVSAFRQSGQALTNQQSSQPGAGLGELFGMFGGLLGGGQTGQGGAFGQGMGGGFGQGMGGGQMMPNSRGGQQNQDMMGGLGQLLQNPMARAGLVNLAAMIGSRMMNRR